MANCGRKKKSIVLRCISYATELETVSRAGNFHLEFIKGNRELNESVCHHKQNLVLYFPCCYWVIGNIITGPAFQKHTLVFEKNTWMLLSRKSFRTDILNRKKSLKRSCHSSQLHLGFWRLHYLRAHTTDKNFMSFSWHQEVTAHGTVAWPKNSFPWWMKFFNLNSKQKAHGSNLRINCWLQQNFLYQCWDQTVPTEGTNQ